LKASGAGSTSGVVGGTSSRSRGVKGGGGGDTRGGGAPGVCPSDQGDADASRGAGRAEAAVVGAAGAIHTGRGNKRQAATGTPAWQSLVPKPRAVEAGSAAAGAVPGDGGGGAAAHSSRVTGHVDGRSSGGGAKRDSNAGGTGRNRAGGNGGAQERATASQGSGGAGAVAAEMAAAMDRSSGGGGTPRWEVGPGRYYPPGPSNTF